MEKKASFTHSEETASTKPRFVVTLALPRDLPNIITEHESEGYEVFAIVATRDSNDHAAYFRLSN
jgi:hypothetical protein